MEPFAPKWERFAPPRYEGENRVIIDFSDEYKNRMFAVWDILKEHGLRVILHEEGSTILRIGDNAEISALLHELGVTPDYTDLSKLKALGLDDSQLAEFGLSYAELDYFASSLNLFVI